VPTYEYECQACHEHVEDVAKFSDPAITICPLCGGELRRVFSGVSISFKGKGFYKNDSRRSNSKSTKTSKSKNVKEKPSVSPTTKESSD
jgi:putative FmdB family regulatory protein